MNRESWGTEGLRAVQGVARGLHARIPQAGTRPRDLPEGHELLARQEPRALRKGEARLGREPRGQAKNTRERTALHCQGPPRRLDARRSRALRLLRKAHPMEGPALGNSDRRPHSAALDSVLPRLLGRR